MNNKKHKIKIAYIGGGSQNWAINLFKDLALCPYLKGEILLYDIDYPLAQRNVEKAGIIFHHSQSKTKFQVRAVKKLEDALKNANYVVISIFPGPIEMMASDLDIPKKYGIFQSVGDTTGPGGIMRALRSVPIYVDFAHKIVKYCPDSWVINYTNPMTLCTSTLYAAEPDIKAFGCCHEVFGTQYKLAKLVNKYLNVPQPDRKEIHLDIAGVNHFTFATEAKWNGIDLFPIIKKHISQKKFFSNRTSAALKRKKNGEWFTSDGLIAYDFFTRFGVLGAAGDRHLAEFVPWYLKSEKEIHRWGVVLTPSSYRIKSYYSARSKKNLLKTFKINELKHTSEEGVNQIMALLGIKNLDTNVNIPNKGQLADLPLGAVLETNAQFRKDSLKPVASKPLPTMLNSLVRHIIEVQKSTLKAAITRDKNLAFQAFLNDPLVNISTDKAWKMFNEMLEATKDMLPGWKI